MLIDLLIVLLLVSFITGVSAKNSEGKRKIIFPLLQDRVILFLVDREFVINMKQRECICKSINGDGLLRANLYLFKNTKHFND